VEYYQQDPETNPDPETARIKFDPNKLNDHYTTLASRLCGKENVPLDAEQLTSELLADTEHSLQMKAINYEKSIKSSEISETTVRDQVP